MELNQREKEVVEKLVQMGRDYRHNNSKPIFGIFGHAAKDIEELILKYLIN